LRCPLPMPQSLPPWSELLSAYAQGYFPMPDLDTDQIHWFRPDPRAILPLNGFHCSHSLQKVIRKHIFSVSFDQCFAEVISQCANRKETWINAEFKRAYQELHQYGYAHSVEVWENKELVGGLYGVQLGGAFFAESMFSLKTNASKIALFELVRHLRQASFSLLEIQFMTPHLKSLGAVEISDESYGLLLSEALQLPCKF